MATKKSPIKKTVPSAKTPTPEVKPRLTERYRQRRDAYLSRRPHRSFRRTRRRDYDRSLVLPGYLVFSFYVFRTLWAHKKLFIGLILVYAILSAVMVGIGSQDAYTTLTNTLKSTSNGIFSGNVGALGQATLLFATTLSGSISQTPTQAQQTFAAVLVLLVWLTSIWLLRNILAGNKVKLRDGLYSAGSPILATFLVGLLIIVQLLPLALAIFGYNAASSTGLLTNGVEAMLFWVAAGLLVLLSVYWVTSSFFALIIVTLPGMYPMQAIKAAGDLVIGRRLRVLLRVLWMLLGVAIFWLVISLPAILIDTWVKSIFPAIQAFPTVPIVILLLSSISIVWMSAYVYLLYRKVVADDASPA